MRIDIWLVENGHAPSRQKAQELIGAERVFFKTTNGESKPIKKPSLIVDEAMAATIHVKTGVGPEFVSRGGLKLFGAAKTLGVSFDSKSVLDVGISTGGFADCALQLGASRVVGIDVGHSQLAPKLRDDPRIMLFEKINARELTSEVASEARAEVASTPSDANGIRNEIRNKILLSNGGKFDIVVIDVSFISLRLVLPSVVGFLGAGGQVLALVKPQFEVGREGVGRNGIVKDAKLYPRVEVSIRDVCASLGLKVESYIESPILGSDGNREFFIHATVPQLSLL